MDKTKILKVAGIVGVVAGAACLYLAGTGEQAVMAIVGAVFVLAGIILAILKQ